ncbi:hypothetical protein [Streptomyces sp. NPDC059979]|uniref:hypothetical protein n=1 Tax=Streptomyces sp. NPDC059979 TaxID=3347021 RepID=UPI00369497D2
MIRIVTAATHAALLADRDELIRTRAALANAREATAKANATAEDFKNTAEFRRKETEAAADARDRALTDLARARKEAEGADTGLQALVRQITAERDTARKEAGALDEVRADLIRLRDHAANPEDGGPVRGAIAYGVLRDLITRARTERAEAGEPGGLPRPFDVIAMVLGFDTAGADADADAPVREEADPGTRVCAACSARRPHVDFDHGAICRNCPAMTASR